MCGETFPGRMIPLAVLLLLSIFNLAQADVERCTTHAEDTAVSGGALLQSKRELAPAANAGGTRDATTLFYHFHLPRTGGTSVANLLMFHVCSGVATQAETLQWQHQCTKQCEMGLTDNEFSCHPGRLINEHNFLTASLQRAEALKATTGAQRIVYVTTLRWGPQRVISSWLYELKHATWLPPLGMPTMSNESLLVYAAGGGRGGLPGMSVRGNMQVAYISSVGSANFNTHIVNESDLRKVKQALLTGQWLIGFADCMDAVNEKMAEWSQNLHGGEYNLREVPHISSSTPGVGPVDVSESKKINLSEETLATVEKYSSFDNALYSWAWEQAEKGEDSRFTRPCESGAMAGRKLSK